MRAPRCRIFPYRVLFLLRGDGRNIWAVDFSSITGQITGRIDKGPINPSYMMKRSKRMQSRVSSNAYCTKILSYGKITVRWNQDAHKSFAPCFSNRVNYQI